MTFTPFASDLAAQRHRDLHQDADAWRRQQSLRRRRGRLRAERPPSHVVRTVVMTLRRGYERGQLGPVCNYVAQ